jgi:hypothetical protein
MPSLFNATLTTSHDSFCKRLASYQKILYAQRKKCLILLERVIHLHPIWALQRRSRKVHLIRAKQLAKCIVFCIDLAKYFKISAKCHINNILFFINSPNYSYFGEAHSPNMQKTDKSFTGISGVQLSVCLL